jgi:hypothetical protein
MPPKEMIQTPKRIVAKKYLKEKSARTRSRHRRRQLHATVLQWVLGVK